MTSLPEVRIGIVGYGTMGRAHSYGYHAAPVMATLPVRPTVALISGRDKDAIARAAAAYGAEGWVTDWHALVEHRPLGEVMRARKVAYYASQQNRGAS